MFFRRRGTVIAEGLKINGNISADGLVEVNGHIEGDVRCRFLFVSAHAVINGGIEAECVAVNGRVEGPIRGSEVVLQSRAHVLGDIQHRSLCVEPGAYFEGRSMHPTGTNVRRVPDTLAVRLQRASELKATREPEDASAA
jgi:cytoskeletal protein CcmA (bactofilin family)